MVWPALISKHGFILAFTDVLRKVSPRVTLEVACALQMLLPATGGIYSGKCQEINHAKALRRAIMGRQRW